MKILINGVTLEGANIVPLLLKIKYWQTRSAKITILGTRSLKDQIDGLEMVSDLEYVFIPFSGMAKSKFGFLVNALKRNIYGIFLLPKLRKRYDVVYSISTVLDLVIIPLLLKFIDPTIKWFVVMDNAEPAPAFRDGWVRYLGGIFFQVSIRLLRAADQVFTTTPSTDLRDILMGAGVQEERILITGCAIEDGLIRAAVKIPEFEADGLFVGRIHESKGVFEMLQALRLIVTEIPSFTLGIVGDGDEETVTRLKAEITAMDLDRNVRFFGVKNGLEKFNIFKSCKLFLFLSAREGFGMALMEAVCSGLPAIAYDLPPFRILYKNNEVIMVDKHDFRAAAEKVVELFRKGRFLNEPGIAMLNRYSWESIAKIEYTAFELKSAIL